MKRILAEGKWIDTTPVARLITEGEKNADQIEILLPQTYGKVELASLNWVLAGISERETRVEQLLEKTPSPDGLLLTWQITEDWAAVPGVLHLELSGTDGNDDTVLKLAGSPIEVRPSAEMFGLPRPDLSEQYLSTMRGLVVEARKAAQLLAETGLVLRGYFTTMEALQAAVPSPALGDLYGVGEAPELYAYVWDGTKWSKGQSLLASVASVNEKAGAVVLSAADVGARSVNWTPNLLEVGGSNQKLLDNSNWMLRGLIVNQRGQESYGGEYGIDRWHCSVGSRLTVNDGSIRISKEKGGEYPIVAQTLEPSLASNLIGREVTLSVLSTEGLFYTTYIVPASSTFDLPGKTIGASNFIFNLFKGTSGSMQFRFYAKSSAVVGDFVDIIAADIEYGPNQTLARQNANGAWQLIDPPPDPTLELMKCQRYQLSLRATARVRAILTTPGRIDFFVPTPVPLRVTPALAVNNMVVISLAGGVAQNGFVFSVFSRTDSGVIVTATKSAHGMTDATLQISYNAAAPLVFDANL